ncbi:universal stress protein UspA-like protein [Leptolyngbyaceae cyanobacterium JSC-12]|nr:universal stress protein UspA-like protein [Leptolyngbyaceae cyanobacterium JSC-12]
MFQRLLICTDLLDGLQRLAHFVPSLAAAGVQEVTFLHCIPFKETGSIPRVNTEKVTQARSQLEVAIKNAPADVMVHVRVESGRPLDLILKVARETNVDLLMLGFSLRSSFSEKLFGSTAAEIYKRTTIPVLSVRPQLISTYTSEELDLRCRHLFRYFMLPYDGTDAAKYLIQQVKQRVLQSSHPVLEACHLVWIVDDCDRREIPREPFIEQGQKELAAAKTELEACHLKVETEVRLGSPVVEVIKASLEPDISAIAVCHNPRNSLLQLSVPSFTQDLLRHSWHPVLYFPLVR